VVHHDPTVAPLGAPVCEVVAVAKRDLNAGERLDGIGGYCTYGLIDSASAAREMGALPIGLSEGCVLRQNVAKDEVISFAQVDIVEDPIVHGLWREQNDRWPLPGPRGTGVFRKRPMNVTARHSATPSQS